MERSECTEAEAMNDSYDEDYAEVGDEDFFEEERQCRQARIAEERKNIIDCLKAAYKTNEQAKVGDLISCPICNKQFIKRSYQHKFCGLRGKGKNELKGHLCKDTYWNLVDDNRRFRSKYFK